MLFLLDHVVKPNAVNLMIAIYHQKKDYMVWGTLNIIKFMIIRYWNILGILSTEKILITDLFVKSGFTHPNTPNLVVKQRKINGGNTIIFLPSDNSANNITIAHQAQKSTCWNKSVEIKEKKLIMFLIGTHTGNPCPISRCITFLDDLRK